MFVRLSTLGYPCSCWFLVLQLHEHFQLEVKLFWPLFRIPVSPGHVVTKVTDELTGLFIVSQFALVLLANVLRISGIVSCTRQGMGNESFSMGGHWKTQFEVYKPLR